MIHQLQDLSYATIAIAVKDTLRYLVACGIERGYLILDFDTQVLRLSFDDSLQDNRKIVWYTIHDDSSVVEITDFFQFVYYITR